MEFVHTVCKIQNSDTDIADIMLATEKFEDSRNFLRHINSKTGQINGLKHHLPDNQSMFDAPVDGVECL